jgi:hypothetical protein
MPCTFPPLWLLLSGVKKNSHNVCQAIKIGIWLSCSNPTCGEAVLLTYFWIEDFSQTDAMRKVKISAQQWTGKTFIGRYA